MRPCLALVLALASGVLVLPAMLSSPAAAAEDGERCGRPEPNPCPPGTACS